MGTLLAYFTRFMPRGLLPSAWVARRILRQTCATVGRGPFQGLRLCAPSWNAHAAKLAGVYEREIYGCLDVLKTCPGWTVLVIGAADGYYAAGLARWDAVREVHAFELDPHTCSLLARNCALNQVEAKVRMQAACTPENLATTLAAATPSTLVICDVEGYEDLLLDLDAQPLLRHCHLLVEVHEVLCPGVGDRLEQRFAATHEIRVIQPEPRRRDEFPFENFWTRWLKDFHVVSAISDGRPGGIFWQWMVPRAAQG